MNYMTIQPQISQVVSHPNYNGGLGIVVSSAPLSVVDVLWTNSNFYLDVDYPRPPKSETIAEKLFR